MNYGSHPLPHTKQIKCDDSKVCPPSITMMQRQSNTKTIKCKDHQMQRHARHPYAHDVNKKCNSILFDQKLSMCIEEHNKKGEGNEWQPSWPNILWRILFSVQTIQDIANVNNNYWSNLLCFCQSSNGESWFSPPQPLNRMQHLDPTAYTQDDKVWMTYLTPVCCMIRRQCTCAEWVTCGVNVTCWLRLRVLEKGWSI